LRPAYVVARTRLPNRRRTAGLVLAGLATATATITAPVVLFGVQSLAPQRAEAQGAPTSILLVSYAVTKSAYDRIIPQFEADWKK